MNFVDEFDGGDCGKNKVRRAFTSTRGPTGADYPSSNYISHAVSNFVSNSAKNVSNSLTADAKGAFDKLRQAFTKAPFFQHFDPEWYIRVETNASRHIIGGVLI